MTEAKTVVQNKQSKISHHECRAFRALKTDGYTHAEIAFMFEVKDTTVGKHVRHECSHETQTVLEKAAKGHTEYSDADLLRAYREVYNDQPYIKMSQTVYDEYRDDTQPSSGAIHNRFGSWPAARKRVWGEEDE
jgi:hypothetical protein